MADLAGPPEAEPQVLGGRRPLDEDWPATFIARGATDCTGSLVGPRLFLTAAHCVANGAIIKLVRSKTEYSAECSRIDGYDAFATPVKDYAMCVLETPLVAPFYERVNDRLASLKVHGKILLTGFGCDSPTGEGAGVFRIGDSEIARLPDAGSYAIWSSGGAASCFGDSGGGAYLADSSTRRRVVIGVQMGGDPPGAGTSETGVNSLTAAVAKAFLERWKAPEYGGICGLTERMAQCRLPPWPQ